MSEVLTDNSYDTNPNSFNSVNPIRQWVHYIRILFREKPIQPHSNKMLCFYEQILFESGLSYRSSDCQKSKYLWCDEAWGRVENI